MGALVPGSDLPPRAVAELPSYVMVSRKACQSGAFDQDRVRMCSSRAWMSSLPLT